jgi:hypothetical protein
MRHFACRRLCLLSVLVLSMILTVAVALPSNGFAASPGQPMTLQELHDVLNGEVSGQKALENIAYVYRGWRNNGGPWFNQVEEWIQSDLDGLGFTEGENSSDDCYWIQRDSNTGSIWIPQYLSMQILGPDGDADPSDPGAYHFDHPEIATFDPTSKYYPSYITRQWILDHMRTPEEEAIQDRCHLATNSAFTSPIDTDVVDADAGAIVADLVDIGTVTRTGTSPNYVYGWTKNTDVPLGGKIIFTSTVPPASMSYMIGLAKQVGARAVMTPAALSDYSHPTIDGVEWYPNNVRYAGASNAGTVVCLNISYQDARYLTALCASKTPQMKLYAIGGAKPYSDTDKLNTLIVEIRGTTEADERVVLMAHVQEPGAEDNASGVGQQLEMLRAIKTLIDDGQLPRPRRTLTFMWGAEMTMSRLYKASHPVEYNKIVTAFSNDMVGADKATTGAVYVIDKMPDPSARYKYQTDVLAGTTPPEPTQFLRQPDTHTLWGAPSLTFYPYPGHFLTDLYFEAGKTVEVDAPDFDTRYRLKPSPWEGGSDAQPFIWNYDTVGGVRVYKPIPGLATFFFTDYTYHSSMDTMKAVSAQRLRDVGLMSSIFAFYRADADLKSAGEVLDIVAAASHQRFGWEKGNAAAHFVWALLHPYGSPATVDGALHETYTGTGNTSTRSIGETQLLNEWGVWYQEAVTSARTLFAAGDATAGYEAHEAATLAAVTADADDAKANAAHLFAAFHFSVTSVAINGGAEWTNARPVTLTLNAASYAPGGVTGMRFSDDGTTWPATFEPYATSFAHTLTAGDGPKTVYAQFQDAEGNVSDAVSASIKLDSTPPVITLTTPADGAAYVRDQAVAADWSAEDAYSGVDTAQGTVASGDLIDTASFGVKSFTVTAADVAGNTASMTVHYSVPFASAGVLPPLSATKVTVVTGGSAAVKFQVFDAEGRSVRTLTPMLHLAKLLPGGAWGSEFAPTSTSAPKSGTVLRYDATSQQYIYNLNIAVLAQGTYRLRIAVGNGGEILARIQVK